MFWNVFFVKIEASSSYSTVPGETDRRTSANKAGLLRDLLEF